MTSSKWAQMAWPPD